MSALHALALGGRMGRAEIAALADAVARSSPEQLGRIVATLDALPDRGEVDRVLDAARSRLQSLRRSGAGPQRPLRAMRLLFLPLDGAILSPGAWRPGTGRVPRTALRPLAELVEVQAPGLWASTETGLEGMTVDRHAEAVALGIALWTEAVTILSRAPAPPPGWVEAGLRPDMFRPLADLCVAVLTHGGAIHQALIEAAAGPPERRVQAALRGPAAAGRDPFAAVLATLLRAASQPGSVAAAAAAMAPFAAPMTDAALADAITQRLPDIASLPTSALPDQVASLCALLDDAARATAARGPDWRHRLETLRHEVGMKCRAAYAGNGQERLLRPAARLVSGQAGDDEVRAIEEEALALRRLELAARGLGSEGVYDAARRALLAQLTEMARAGPAPARVEIARLAETLGGPEAGLAILSGARAN